MMLKTNDIESTTIDGAAKEIEPLEKQELTTIESARGTRDIYISNNPATWKRTSVTYISVKKYDMSAPISARMRKFVESEFDLRPCEVLDEAIVGNGDDGQAITDILCEKYGLEKRRYTGRQII